MKVLILLLSLVVVYVDAKDVMYNCTTIINTSMITCNNTNNVTVLNCSISYTSHFGLEGSCKYLDLVKDSNDDMLQLPIIRNGNIKCEYEVGNGWTCEFVHSWPNKLVIMESSNIGTIFDNHIVYM